jgi:hypothetical protein
VYATAKVTVMTTSGALVPNATVTGTWSGVVNGGKTAVTNASGVATLTSPQTKKSGTYKFTITGITASGYTYDAALNTMTSNSITR